MPQPYTMRLNNEETLAWLNSPAGLAWLATDSGLAWIRSGRGAALGWRPLPNTPQDSPIFQAWLSTPEGARWAANPTPNYGAVAPPVAPLTYLEQLAAHQGPFAELAPPTVGYDSAQGTANRPQRVAPVYDYSQRLAAREALAGYPSAVAQWRAERAARYRDAFLQELRRRGINLPGGTSLGIPGGSAPPGTSPTPAPPPANPYVTEEGAGGTQSPAANAAPGTQATPTSAAPPVPPASSVIGQMPWLQNLVRGSVAPLFGTTLPLRETQIPWQMPIGISRSAWGRFYPFEREMLAGLASQGGYDWNTYSDIMQKSWMPGRFPGVTTLTR